MVHLTGPSHSDQKRGEVGHPAQVHPVVEGSVGHCMVRTTLEGRNGSSDHQYDRISRPVRNWYITHGPTDPPAQFGSAFIVSDHSPKIRPAL